MKVRMLSLGMQDARAKRNFAALREGWKRVFDLRHRCHASQATAMLPLAVLLRLVAGNGTLAHHAPTINYSTEALQDHGVHKHTSIFDAHAGVLDESLQRDVPEGSCAFWACIRRAFPNAQDDPHEYELALSNVGLVYGAGSETTAMAISLTMAALAADPESMRKLEQVW